MNKRAFLKQFKEIQKDRRGVVDSSVYPGIKELVSEIYPEEAHFIYELLQNAEDAGANSVYFGIKKDMLVFKHNGPKMFDAADVDSITNIARSTKKENFVQAGKFGIGFKSVYAFTDTPYIYCDSVCFRIDQLLLPVMIKDIAGREKGWTEFHFLFNSSKINPEDAKDKIMQGLSEIDSTTMLFLNNIKKLEYRLGKGPLVTIIKEEDSGRTFSFLLRKGKKELIGNAWMRFSRDSELDGKRVQVDIAFPLEYQEKDGAFRFFPGEDTVCIKFRAKNEKSNLKFCINAPFGCTPSRDTVNKDDRLNRILIKELALLMESAIGEICEKELMSDGFLELLPLKEDGVPQFYMPIVNAVWDSFILRQSLPTMTEGQYVKVSNGIMSSRNVIDKLFSQDDIRNIYQNGDLFFVKNQPVTSRAYRFLKALKINELTPDNVLLQMIKIPKEQVTLFFQTRGDERLADLYAFFYRGFEFLLRQTEKLQNDYGFNDDTQVYAFPNLDNTEVHHALIYQQLNDCIKKIRDIKMIRTDANEMTFASETYFEEKGIEIPQEFKLIKKSLYKKELSKKFLVLMGAKTFSREELQKYKYQGEIRDMKQYMRTIHGAKQKDAIDISRTILGFLRNHEHSEISWNDYDCIEVFDLKKKGLIFKRARDCYLDKPLFEETGFRDAESIHRKYQLSDSYCRLNEGERNLWIEFLKKNEVLWNIAVQSTVNNTEYKTGVDIDFHVKNLESYLKRQSTALSRYIWKKMIDDPGWKSDYREHYYKLNRKYSGQSEDSSALKIFKSVAWIPDQHGVFHKPSDVSRNTIDKTFPIDETTGFLDAIGFGARAKFIEQQEQYKSEKKRLEEKQQVEAAQRLGFRNAEEVMLIKSNSRKIDELRELGIDIDELIQHEKNRRKEKERQDIESLLNGRKDEQFQPNTNGDEEDYVPGVKNPFRRRKKIAEEIAQDSEEQEKSRSVQSKRSSNKEEKTFLYGQYNGKCQICGKVIVKRDGSNYFEAINLLDTSKLEMQYQKGLSTGWNSLCLCPNCAAEYTYGAVSLYDFQEKVLSLSITRENDALIPFEIKLQGENRLLNYTPVHLFHLQTALLYFRNLAHEENIDDAKKIIHLRNDKYMDATKMWFVPSGNKCPACNRIGIITQIDVYDTAGNLQDITAYQCICGTIYLTKKQYSLLKHKENYWIISSQPSSQGQHTPSPLAPMKPHSSTPHGKAGNSYTVKKNKKKIIMVGDIHKIKKLNKCKKCGAEGTFQGTGLCWDCYKEYKQSLFD